MSRSCLQTTASILINVPVNKQRFELSLLVNNAQTVCASRHLQRNDDDKQLLLSLRQDVFDEGVAGANEQDRHQQQRAFHPETSRMLLYTSKSLLKSQKDGNTRKYTIYM